MTRPMLLRATLLALVGLGAVAAAVAQESAPKSIKSEPVESPRSERKVAKKESKSEAAEPARAPAEADDEAEALPAAGPVAGQTHLLRYKIAKGDQLRWEIVHQVDFDTTVSGTTQRAKTYSKSTKLWRVLDVQADGTFTFEHIVEDTSMWQELSGRARVEWDSKKDESAPSGFEAVAATLGKPLFRVEMDAQGKLLKKVNKHAGKGAEIVEEEGDEERQMTLPLPKEAIPVGYSWHFPFEIKLPLEGGGVKVYKAREKFDLTSVKDGIATIAIETQVLTPVRDPAVESQLIQRGGRGEVKFDIKRGRVISQQVDVDKSVVGFRGQASSIHYVSRFTERLLADREKRADTARPADAEPEKTAAKPKATEIE